MQTTPSCLARRVGQIRRELFGEHGVPVLAEQLNLPSRTWMNFESGVNIPAAVLLHFMVITRAEPDWLYTGDGRTYRVESEGGR